MSFLESLAREVTRRAGPVAKLLPALTGLHEGFTGSRGSRPEEYLEDEAILRAYLASFTVPNAARAVHVLKRLRLGLKAGESALDAGAGTGSAALALASLSHRDSEIVLADTSGAALAVATELFAALFPDGPRVRAVEADVARGLPTAGKDSRFRSVLAGHLLNELLPRRGREPGPALDAARILGRAAGKTGDLVILEPAQRIPSFMLCRIRAALLESGFRPVGPCSHSGRCPVLGRGTKDWCVTDVPFRRPPIIEEIDRRLGLSRRRLTVSWLAVSQGAKPAGGDWVELMSETMRAKQGHVVYACSPMGKLALGFDRPPKRRLRRGMWLRLPADTKPSGRDRSGAPLVPVDPDKLPRRG